MHNERSMLAGYRRGRKRPSSRTYGVWNMLQSNFHERRPQNAGLCCSLFSDSKTLTEEKRDSIFEKLNDAKHLIGWMVEIISPHNISTNMLRRAKVNLNILSHDCAIRLIQRVLDRGVNVKEIYVDTVGDPAKYQAKLKELFPEIDITVAAKADANYEIVGAASICAKVARDKAVKRWIFNEGIEMEDNEYGSGYPGDPNTKKFLMNNMDKVFGFPSFVRFSWSTADKLIEEHCVNVSWEDDDEEENMAVKNTPSVVSFFTKKDDGHLERHRFFKDRCLISVDKL
ncbi:hypothetical protein ACJMK2_005974 [Sinanodonta woodiana]|uniref:Ribonuclease n=1 Tax=Sinanodonta woodiana TaxID=1069815 RepID=A0ABD3VUH9_SINWO